ncbi:MAG: D-alanyl-D-alanine carboxypeptidase family protein [Hyphomonadaceae bacterium]
MKTISPIAWVRRVAFALLAMLCVTGPAWADKYASIVVDLETGQVMHDRSADEPRHPASLTKVMTLYLVFDAIDSGKLKLTDRIKVSKAASRAQPSKLGLKSGTTIKVEDAIRALVTKSANDVAIVLAEKLGGSEAKFAVKMNAKAKELGMLNTTFRNASGLPDKKQITTARDMAKLGEAIYMDHKNRYNYFSLSSFTWGKRKYMNHNELLRKVDGVDGIKTGFTNASGYNLMASAERNGRRVIAVMLGGKTGRSRDAHVADLLEAAFMDLTGVQVAGADDIRARIAFGDRGTPSTADDLALAQLRRLQEPDAALVASLDSDAFADEVGTAEDGDEGIEVSEGDAAGPDADDPIGALIEASPGATPISMPATTVPNDQAILVTSQLSATPAPNALDLLALPAH